MSDLVELNNVPDECGAGCEQRSGVVGAIFPTWESDKYEDCPVIPKAEWQDMAPLTWAIYDLVYQNGYPSCCLSSLAQSAQAHLAICGREHIKLDHLRAWRDLSGGRGGVALDYALQYVREKGFPIIGSQDRLFAAEVWDCPDAAAYFSGIQRGCRGIHGRFVTGGGHAEHGLYVRKVDGQWTVRVPGTWGPSHGEDGYYDVTEASIDRGIPSFGAFLVREWELRSSDTQDRPDAKG